MRRCSPETQCTLRNNVPGNHVVVDVWSHAGPGLHLAQPGALCAVAVEVVLVGFVALLLYGSVHRCKPPDHHTQSVCDHPENQERFVVLVVVGN